MGAHYDHEGVKNGVVYYGADDNGSGTVAILEAARQLTLSKNNRRPVLIIFHAAEEKGLKGSKYLTANSDFVDSIIVHLNFDMVGRKSEDSIYCIGASKISTQLGKLIEDVNAKTTNLVLDYKFDDPNDPLRLYYRSDHYNYAKLGIPVAFFYDHMMVDYTKPTDTVNKINFEKLLRITDLA
jgi:Zn-dependent M28 family amino/carboxypeptidase